MFKKNILFKKQFYFKIDFDKWRSEDDDEAGLNISSNKLDELDSENVVADHMSFNLENLRKTYLFVYNLWQFVGFTYIFSILMFKYSTLGYGKFFFYSCVECTVFLDIFMQIMLFILYYVLGKFIKKKVLDLVCMQSANKI